ncbi:MAG TPA: hypothetical protein VMB73_09905 [Acetobacteraceae bacterium]|jgi:hypothetical protein|nr:hypothetical protein [Acetobacteraceae bacterium]
MNAVPFDTLKVAQRLEAAGFSGSQAAGAAEALADVLAGTDPATKADVNLVRSNLDQLRSNVDQLRSEMATKADLNAVERGLRSDIAALETRLTAAIELVRRDMTIKLGGMIVIGVGVLAALRYLPVHP